MFTAVTGHAHAGAGHIRYRTDNYDSLLPWHYYSSVHAGIFMEVLDAENNFRQSGNTQKAVKKLLRIAGMKRAFRNNTLGTRILLDIGNLSTRLKMYSLAMTCYHHAIGIKKEKEFSDYPNRLMGKDTSSGFRLVMASREETAFQTAFITTESPPVLPCDIQRSFQDGKTASAFAIILHVKQPLYGRRKAFCHINNVGHSFITLVKLNDDNSSVSRSFGYYPAKSSLFGATPVHPGDRAVIKDDALHPWDETVAKFISEKKFNRILANLEKFSHTQYNLNHNNCTDFGLSEACIAGIDIKETFGKWPMGKGNNPANAGQSLLENKFENRDPEYPEVFPVHEGQVVFDDLP